MPRDETDKTCPTCYEPFDERNHVCRLSTKEGDKIHRNWLVLDEHRFVIDKRYHDIFWQNETENQVVLVIRPKPEALRELGETPITHSAFKYKPRLEDGRPKLS